MVRMVVSLHMTGLVVSEERCENATSVYSSDKTRQHRVIFGLDIDDQLSLCVACESKTVDDVLGMILRPVLGL